MAHFIGRASFQGMTKYEKAQIEGFLGARGIDLDDTKQILVKTDVVEVHEYTERPRKLVDSLFHDGPIVETRVWLFPIVEWPL
jgi:hypothetical protein